MARYQVILAYDGTRYQGFQRQAGCLTVQAVFESALSKLGWQDRVILSAGRTDTGVHAAGQVVAFDLEWKHSVEELRSALNANLPDDVAVRKLLPAPADFHPRYAATGRCYRYRIYCDAVRDPLKEYTAWRVWPAVELQQLQSTARQLIGKHDFVAFGAPMRKGGSTIRKVMWAGWQSDGSDLVFEIGANAFLYHMVRRLVAAQVQVAQGRCDPLTIRQLLEDPQSGAIQGLAPAHGLVLQQVYYQEMPSAGQDNMEL